jgi:putative intracellular protease/amidase
MTRASGLQGKRIALLCNSTGDVVGRVLSDAGATVDALSVDGQGTAQWHSTPYAALVIVGALPNANEDRAVQLIREFLIADKPVAVQGAAVALLLTSGGVAGRSVAADPSMEALIEPAGATLARESVYADEGVITARSDVAPEEFASRLATRVERLLDDQRVDEMSDLSFPASDPPAVSPAAVGRPTTTAPEPREPNA